MEKKELPEEIQIKKVQKADSEIKYISFGIQYLIHPRHFRCKKEIVTNP